MACYSCTAEFGLLKKETGCDACGFSFCPKCCKKQTVSSANDGNVTKTLCNKCYQQSTGDAPCPKEKGSPPLAHKKRMESLKKQSCSVDSSTHARLKSQWSNDKDKQLAERLQKLKRGRMKEDLPSEAEIGERLAKLKGMDPSLYTAPPIQVFRPSDKRSSVEQASDLMKQVTDEVALDAQRAKPDDEIARRLAKLRVEEQKKTGELNIPISDEDNMDIESAHSAFQTDSHKLSEMACKEFKELNLDMEYQKALLSMKNEKESEETDEEEADRLVEKILATSLAEDMESLDSLKDDSTEKSSASSKKDPLEEEFPWCVICTEDAKIRCFGCDEDLYCSRCFRECHDSLDIRDHKTCPFLPPKAPVL